MLKQLKIKDVIDKLETLNDKDYTIGMEVEPEVNCLEQLDGTGWETTRYIYTIVLRSDEIVKKYKNHNGIKEYIDK